MSAAIFCLWLAAVNFFSVDISMTDSFRKVLKAWQDPKKVTLFSQNYNARARHNKNRTVFTAWRSRAIFFGF